MRSNLLSAMEFRICSVLSLLIVFSLLSPQARCDGDGSVFFIDNSSNQFLRSRPSNNRIEQSAMLLPEVGAAVSVLLGFAPPSTLSSAGSSKLNEILVPNPFDRPRAVFLLEVDGINDPKQVFQDTETFRFSHESRNLRVLGSDKAEIQLPNEDEVLVLSLDELLEDFTDKEINDYASLMGGSYAIDTLEPLSGVLTIPLASGAMLEFHMSKKSEREFVVGILSLSRNVRRAIQMHEDLSQSTQSPAELLTGCFHGIKVLQERYGAESIAQHGFELLLATLTKIFDSLQEAYEGQIVGVIYFYTTPQEFSKKFDVVSATRPAARWLAEAKGVDAKIAEVALVRRTLAWVTGIILLISTLIGVYCLLNMPLTRDTLLYSNVKLD